MPKDKNNYSLLNNSENNNTTTDGSSTTNSPYLPDPTNMTNHYHDMHNNYIVSKNFIVNKLIKTLEYNYEIELDGTPGNWPVVVIPRSGTFIANSKNKEINATIIFCPNTGICGPNNPDVLPYNIDYSCGFKNKNLLFTNLRLKVNEKGTDDFIYSDTKHVECVDCLASPKASFYGDTMLNRETDNITTITTKLSGLIPGQQYFWFFNKKASNWPTTIYPISGSFISSENTYNINSIISFCKDASCSGSLGYIEYDQDDNSSIYKHLNLNFILNSDDHCYFDNADYSLMVTCKDCISRPKVLLNIEKLSLENNCTDIDVVVSGLDPYQHYSYNFTSYSANWPITISPISGSFSTSNNTSLTMPFKVAFCGSESLCSGDPNLINYHINYDKLYSDTSCEKYAYIQYNLSKISNLTTQNDSLIFPSNPIAQSEVIRVSCKDCSKSHITKIDNVINTNMSYDVPPDIEITQ